MKFYKITAPSTDSEDTIIWASTQAGVVAAKKGLMESGLKRKQISSKEVEVPTKKEELLEWLNKRDVT